MTHKILIEGWCFISHSYACVNMWQLLDLLKRNNNKIYFNEKPFFNNSWKPIQELLSPESDKLLHSIPELPGNVMADATYRIDFPFNFTKAKTKKLFVFGTSEIQEILPEMVAGNREFKEALTESQAIIITPSNWSAQGFINSGADPERVKVIPLGVDTSLFHPVSENEKLKLREELGWNDFFIFLHIGVMTNNKGIRYLLKAFAYITEYFPNARLCLKGSENLYYSSKLINDSIMELNDEEMKRASSRIIYYGDTLSFSKIANLYQAADAYVSPYTAEGFNLPVLEAVASGLPVICTKGGPTDEFTKPFFARRIKSRVISDGKAKALIPDLSNLIYNMSSVIKDKQFQKSARLYGPKFVENSFTWTMAVDKLLEIMFPD